MTLALAQAMPISQQGSEYNDFDRNSIHIRRSRYLPRGRAQIYFITPNAEWMAGDGEWPNSVPEHEVVERIEEQCSFDGYEDFPTDVYVTLPA